MPQDAVLAGPSTEAESTPDRKDGDSMQPRKQKNLGGGGGADAHHGHAYHVGVVILLLYSLKDISQKDLGFQYEISLEKEGYGKFDDIVLKYKFSGGEWIELCIQCKHAAKENDTITAKDFVSTKPKENKIFNLFKYIVSLTEINNAFPNSVKKRFGIILCNRKYNTLNDSSYPCFERINISRQPCPAELTLLPGDAFQIEFNDSLVENLAIIGDLQRKDIYKFCDSFVYICDKRSIAEEIKKISDVFCYGNVDASENLQGRLNRFVFDNIGNSKNALNVDDINQIFYKKEIRFQLPPVNENYTGREDDLQKLEEALDHKGNKLIDVSVTGLPGVGKTQLVTKYIENNRTKFRNIIWINAESENSIESSFVELAEKCSLVSSDSNQDVSKVIEAVYEYLSTNAIFIFDNAEHKLLKKNHLWYYLPNPKHETLKIVVISQNKQWDSMKPIDVHCFSEEDAINYINNAIKNKCGYTEDEIKILAHKFNYWPLALSLAASYIKQELEESLVNPLKLSDITDTIYKQEETLVHHEYDIQHMNLYNKSLMSIWQLLEKKIQNLDCKGVTIQILEVIAFTEPDRIPFTLLLSYYLEKQIKLFLKHTTNYSIVTKHENSFSIHRTLQLIIRASLKEERKIEIFEVENMIVTKYLDKLDIYEEIKWSTNIHCIAMWNHILKSEELFPKYYRTLKQISNKLEQSKDVLLGIKFLGKAIKMLNSKTAVDNEIFICTNSAYAVLLSYSGRYAEGLQICDEVLNNSEIYLSECEFQIILHNKASVLDNMGKYDEALKLYDQVLEVRRVKLGTNHLSTLTTMNNKALVLNKMGKYDEALKLYDQVLEVRRVKLGTDHPSTLTTIHNKALVLNKMGQYDEALSLYDHILEFNRVKLGTDHPSTLTTIHNKALVLYKMGKYDEALSLYDQVLENERVKLGTDHPDTLTTMHNKASVLDNMGKYDEALKLYDQVLEVNRVKLGTDHPSTLTTMNNKALVLNKMGKYNEALSLYDHVLEFNRVKLGTDHPSTFTTIHNKALVLYKMGKYDEALSLYDQVLEVERVKLGTDHPDTLTTMHNQASVLDKMGIYDEALSLYDQVLEVEIVKLGTDHLSTLTTIQNKALVLKNMGKYDEALSLYDQVLEASRVKLGTDHPSTLTTMHNKASVLDNMGKYDEALSLYDQVLEVKRVKLGTDHPSTLTTMNNKASVLDKMGIYDEAMSLYDQVLEVRRVKLGTDHLSTLTTIHNKALVLNNIGKYDEALSLYDQVLEVRRVKLGTDHPDTLTTMHNQASVLDKMGIYDEALSLYDQVLKVEIVKLGTDHLSTLTTIHNKALVLKNMGKYDEALSLYDQVLEARRVKLGTDHPDTLTTMHNKASVLDNIRKYDEALSLYDQVLEARRAKLGTDHPDTLNTSIKRDAICIIKKKATSM